MERNKNSSKNNTHLNILNWSLFTTLSTGRTKIDRRVVRQSRAGPGCLLYKWRPTPETGTRHHYVRIWVLLNQNIFSLKI